MMGSHFEATQVENLGRSECLELLMRIGGDHGHKRANGQYTDGRGYALAERTSDVRTPPSLRQRCVRMAAAGTEAGSNGSNLETVLAIAAAGLLPLTHRHLHPKCARLAASAPIPPHKLPVIRGAAGAC